VLEGQPIVYGKCAILRNVFENVPHILYFTENALSLKKLSAFSVKYGAHFHECTEISLAPPALIPRCYVIVVIKMLWF